MSSSKNETSQAEKEKGNIAFRAGRYPEAIGHYSAAIIADRNSKDVTIPLNRAAAYLKLGKYEDAERDCTKVLNIDAKNVKALYRRGQARIELDKAAEAKEDLAHANKLDPKNAAVKEELQKVETLLAKKVKKKSLVSASMSSQPDPVRRRVPIKIVNPPSTVTSSKPARPSPSKSIQNGKPTNHTSDPLRPISTRSLATSSTKETETLSKDRPSTSSRAEEPSIATKTEATPLLDATSSSKPDRVSSTSTLQATSHLDTFKEVKRAREGRLGGGIFRASGDSKLFDVKEITDKSPEKLVTPPQSPPSSLPANPEFPVPHTPKDDNPLPPHKSSSLHQNLGDLSSVRESSNVGKSLNMSEILNTGETTNAGQSSSLPPVSPPQTLFEFSKAWARFPSVEDRWRIIRSIPTKHIPTICKASLDPALFASILETLHTILKAAPDGSYDAVMVRAYMESLARVPRFGTLVLLLSKEERARALDVWKMLGVKVPVGPWAAVLQS